MKKEGKEKRRERRYEVVSLHMESHQPDGILLVVIAGWPHATIFWYQNLTDVSHTGVFYTT
jgi:hypothetical protein